MRVRHLARQRALQLLYALHHATGDETFDLVERRFLRAEAAHQRGWGPFGRKLAMAAWMRRRELDEKIGPCLHKWTLDRIPLAELICLRMALAELLYFEDVPMKVTINEYVELARLFGDDDAPKYVNAILDRLAQGFKHKDFQSGGEPDREDGEVSAELNTLIESSASRLSAAEPPNQEKEKPAP